MDLLISLVVGVAAFVLLDAIAIAILLILAPVALAVRDGVTGFFVRDSRQPVTANAARAQRTGLASEPR